MNRNTYVKTLGFSLLASALLVGCGSNSSSGNGSNQDNMGNQGNIDNEEGSNIPYLRVNHANYTEHGSNQTPAPTKDANAKSINWTIAANTEEGAEKLVGHIEFMDKALEEDRNPRAFDTLFVMEAYMKFNKYYTTNVEKSSTNVIVSKNASTACAYEVISAHADVVSGDFFAQGVLNNDHSARAEAILATSACDGVRTDLTAYIAERKRSMGSMGSM
ncbi:MAG: hypothetical protein Q9M36_04170 [Sulfurovum sp.]|nr:hypothetical protein [Sulfurovum sp.]